VSQFLLRLRDETDGLAYFMAAALESEQLNVAGTAQDADGAVRLAREKQPDLLVVDVDVVDDEETVIDLVHEVAPDTKVMVVSCRDPLDTAPGLFSAGGHGYVERTVHPGVLLEEAVALVTDATRTMAGHLDRVPQSSRRGRRLTSRAAAAWGHDHLSEALELLVSELVTNALRHAEGNIEVVMRLGETSVRVEVHDDSPVVPSPVDRGTEAPSGRGLRIVEALAARWGVRSCRKGKSVWFELEHTTDKSPGVSSAT
jgi:DNA-binding NarL/FixJ family response regulator